MSEKLFNVGIKAIVRRGNKLLVAHNTAGGGFWEVPGGRMDGNETIEEALLRELKEELPNIQNIQVGKLIGATRIHKDIKPEVSLVLLFFVVNAEFAGGEPKLSDEHDEYRWLTKEEAIEVVYDKYKEVISTFYLSLE